MPGAVAVPFSTALAFALCLVQPIAAAEATTDSGVAGAPASDASPPKPAEGNPGTDLSAKPRAGSAAAGSGAAPSTDKGPARNVPTRSFAQFVIPKRPIDGKAPPALPSRLTYQYAYGTESDIVYYRNPDLDGGVRDDTLLLKPQVHGYFTYRPADWLEGTLEMVFDREIAAMEEQTVVLPNGETQLAQRKSFSLLVDQAFLTIKAPTDRFQFTVGRRSYSDDRAWLVDASLDTVSVALKLGKFRGEAVFGREILVGLDLLKDQTALETRTTAAPSRAADRINTYMILGDYRGIEDMKLGAYVVFRDDRGGVEGRPLTMGVRALGTPTDELSYWGEFAHQRGTDETFRPLSAFAFDLGATYRFTGLPLYPNVTLGYAFGSGDGNPDDGVNHEFRQTGLQSNEVKFAGIAKFKAYGEALDPELSNLMILTASIGVRLARNVALDLVYHRYWLNEYQTELRSSLVTALMNQVEGRRSKDVGSAFDVVLGFRNLFGLRRLGIDLRTGFFLPGNAFLVNTGDENNPGAGLPGTGFTVFTKFLW